MFLTNRDLEWFFRPVQSTGKVARYPLTNLGTDKEGVLYIEVAVAGFDKENITLELKGSQLHIKGTLPEVAEENKIEYVQQHISSLDFERIVVMQENYIGGEINANVKNGILTITVKPKEPTRKLIAISE